MTSMLAIAAFERPCAMSKDFSVPWRERGQGVGAAAGPQKLAHDFRVEHGAACATLVIASMKSLTSATRSLSR